MMIFHQMGHEHTGWSVSYCYLNATFPTRERRQSVLGFNVERLKDKVGNDYSVPEFCSAERVFGLCT